MGIPKDSAAGRAEFERAMELRRAQETHPEWQRLRRGWCLGAATFREELLEQVHAQSNGASSGPTREESSEQQAQRIVREELRRRAWRTQELARRRKGDAGKVEIAQRLRTETTMTLAWIAQSLSMGTAGHVANQLRQAGQTG